MTRTPYIAANWKMHKTKTDVQDFCNVFSQKPFNTVSHTDIVICPPSIWLDTTFNSLKNTPVKIGSQNIHQAEEGAYTGEISASMVRSLGASITLIGHSERRQYFNETNEIVNQKLHLAYTHQLQAVVCIGESLEEREANNTNTVLTTQLTEGLKNAEALIKAVPSQLVIAYEPIWAIGTGKVASTEQAQEAHHHIRNVLSQLVSADIANQIRILYGGSVKPTNSQELLSQPDIDGALIGGASLEVESFWSIIKG